jgi:hypothetical protein
MQRMGDTDARMAGHLFLDMPSSVTVGIVEMQMQSATSDIPRLLNLLVG